MNGRANRTGMGWAALALGVALSGSGCFGERSDYKARMDALEAEGKALNASADGLEERLLGSQGSLQLWTELGRRHQAVSAIACTNQNEHLEGMVKYLTYQQEKGRRLRHSRVVDSEPVAADVEPTYTRVAQAGKHSRTVRP